MDPSGLKRVGASREISVLGETHRASPWPVTAVCLGWILGTAWHLQTVVLQATWIYAAGLGLGWLACGVAVTWRWDGGRRMRPARRRPFQSAVTRRHTRRLLAAMLAAWLAVCTCGWRAALQAQQALPEALEGQALVLQGVVAQLPQVNRDGLRFPFQVERAWYAREIRQDVWSSSVQAQALPKVPTRVLLGWRTPGEGRGVPSVRAGDRWLLPVRLKAPHGQLNPHGFDFEVWLWSQGVLAVGQVSVFAPAEEGATTVQPRRLAEAVAYPVERWRQASRDRLWAQGLDTQAAGVLSALLLGDQASIDPVDWDVFRRTGVAHLMSISGLHITLLAALARWAVQALWTRGLWRRRPLALWRPASLVGHWGGWWVAVAYALFSGWGLPAQRTVIMLGTAVLLRTLGTPWPWSATWLLAGAMVLAWDPWAWWQAGFWLSLVAVGLLMALDARLEQRQVLAGAMKEKSDSSQVHPSEGPLIRPPISSSNHRLVLALRTTLQTLRQAWVGLCREQMIMTLGLAPLTLLLFHEVSLLGWLANLVAIPWVTLCITPLALLGVVWPMAWQAGAWCLAGLQGVLHTLVGWGVPAWSVAAFPWWVASAGVVGCALLCWRGPWGWRWWGLPLSLPAMCWQSMPPAEGEMAIVAADVGQGQAVLVRTARHVLLYDAGPRYAPDVDAGQRVVLPLLQSLGLPLDRLVLSHRDSDHTGGARAVLAMHPQADVLGDLPDLSSEVTRIQPCQAGLRWTWDGVHFEVLHPQSGSPMRAASNARSCVLRIQAASASVLLAGDIEAPEEIALVQRVGAALRADVLLVPHHGSKTSSTAVLLDQVQPQWAWVQAGYRNRFGHPAPSVMARYRARGIQVLETARCGAIQWSSQSPQSPLCERARRQRYWHHQPSESSGGG